MRLVATSCLVGILMCASAADATTPQAPIAAGPFESIVEVLRAAHACGVRRLRIDSRRSDSQGEARLYLDDQPEPEALVCLTARTTRSGRRLGLLPRWHGDTFEQDAP